MIIEGTTILIIYGLAIVLAIIIGIAAVIKYCKNNYTESNFKDYDNELDGTSRQKKHIKIICK